MRHLLMMLVGLAVTALLAIGAMVGWGMSAARDSHGVVAAQSRGWLATDKSLIFF